MNMGEQKVSEVQGAAVQLSEIRLRNCCQERIMIMKRRREREGA